MLGQAGMAMAAGWLADQGGGPAPSGPDGPPTNASHFNNGGSLAVQWTNGDTGAQTQIGTGVDADTDPTSVTYTVAPGETSEDVALCDPLAAETFWYVRHIEDAIPSDWVYVTGWSEVDCGE